MSDSIRNADLAKRSVCEDFGDFKVKLGKDGKAKVKITAKRDTFMHSEWFRLKDEKALNNRIALKVDRDDLASLHINSDFVEAKPVQEKNQNTPNKKLEKRAEKIVRHQIQDLSADLGLYLKELLNENPGNSGAVTKKATKLNESFEKINTKETKKTILPAKNNFQKDKIIEERLKQFLDKLLPKLTKAQVEKLIAKLANQTLLKPTKDSAAQKVNQAFLKKLCNSDQAKEIVKAQLETLKTSGAEDSNAIQRSNFINVILQNMDKNNLGNIKKELANDKNFFWLKNVQTKVGAPPDSNKNQSSIKINLPNFLQEVNDEKIKTLINNNQDAIKTALKNCVEKTASSLMQKMPTTLTSYDFLKNANFASPAIKSQIHDLIQEILIEALQGKTATERKDIYQQFVLRTAPLKELIQAENFKKLIEAGIAEFSGMKNGLRGRQHDQIDAIVQAQIKTIDKDQKKLEAASGKITEAFSAETLGQNRIVLKEKASKLGIQFSQGKSSCTIVSKADIAARTRGFAEDNQKTRTQHYVMLASQTNCLELNAPDQKIDVKKPATYFTDNTQGPGGITRNLIAAQSLLSSGKYSGGKKDGFDGYAAIGVETQNGYYLEPTDIQQANENITRLCSNWQKIQTKAVMNMPVTSWVKDDVYQGATLELQTDLDLARELDANPGTVNMILASGIPGTGSPYERPQNPNHDLAQAAALMAGYELFFQQSINDWLEKAIAAKEENPLRDIPKPVLHLTALGEGAFGNSPDMVNWAIDRVARKYVQEFDLDIVFENYGDKATVERMNLFDSLVQNPQTTYTPLSKDWQRWDDKIQPQLKT